MKFVLFAFILALCVLLVQAAPADLPDDVKQGLARARRRGLNTFGNYEDKLPDDIKRIRGHLKGAFKRGMDKFQPTESSVKT